jgi:hypothetical protein
MRLSMSQLRRLPDWLESLGAFVGTSVAGAGIAAVRLVIEGIGNG